MPSGYSSTTCKQVTIKFASGGMLGVFVSDGVGESGNGVSVDRFVGATVAERAIVEAGEIDMVFGIDVFVS